MSEMPETVDELVEGVLAGDARLLARAISLVEDGDVRGADIVRAISERTGGAQVVGLTGAPGAGKSSLLAALVGVLRGARRTVGVVSVDPSSPFTQGALLGDRVRLAEHFTDSDVFIRSMGTRGSAGGLAAATFDAVRLLDASGKDVVLVETVGAGQAEVDVARIADVVVLLVMPGGGDTIQALKAGIMEVPDVIAVTKGDLPAAAAAVADVRAGVGLEPDTTRRPTIVVTSAHTGDGVTDLVGAIESVFSELRESGRLAERRTQAAIEQAVAAAREQLNLRFSVAISNDEEMKATVAALARHELDPITASEHLLARALEVIGSERADAR